MHRRILINNIFMKKIITFFSLILLLLVNSNTFSQTPHPFELGFNFGASWLKADVKMKKLGSGAGLTFGQTYCMNQTSPLLWGWRFRYLNANTFGQDSKRSNGIANNEVLNGTDTSLDYYHTSGYVYQNYKTHIDELSLELLIGGNKLYQQTRFYPYLFAGAGLTKAVARINQLDNNGKMYNYPLKDSLGTSLNSLYDSTYETLGDGNAHPQWKFMPSVGVGISYELIRGFSIGLEHKVTWALNDVLDGQRWSATNKPTGNNDLYHYTSFWLKFSFGRGKRHYSTTSTSTTNNVVTTNNTNTTTSIPAIVFTNPASDPYNSNQQNINISGTVTNINTGSDMTMTLNGTPVAGYTYNTTSHVFNYPATLQNGANTFVVTATNVAGTSNASATVYYIQPTVGSEMAPVIKINFPAQSPYTTGKNNVTVTGTIQNVSTKNQIKVSINGVETSVFNYNSTSHAFSINSNLILGANSFTISASNPAGNDSKTTTVILKQDVVNVPNLYIAPPAISFISPNLNPATTSTSFVNITASVLNVNSVNEIIATLNGSLIPTNALFFTPTIHQLKFKVSVVPGSNSVIVSASNSGGQDSKTLTINYVKPIETPPVVAAPVVNILSPSSNPFSTSIGTTTINGTVLNVTSAGQISVTMNGAVMPSNAINFNAASHELIFNVNLIQGTNSIIIAATNAGGKDSKTQTINYTQPVLTPAPAITITSPSVNPFATTINTATINATILNITNANQITVKLNGFSNNAFAFNAASKQFSLSANLIVGTNTIVITATNESGSDAKSQTINYTAPLPPVVTFVNPATINSTTSTSSYPVVAKATNVLNANEINVKVNGISITAFTFQALTKKITFNANLIEGNNSVQISATTSSGSDNKSVSIKYVKLNVSNTAKFDTTKTTPVIGLDDDQGGTPVNTPPGGHDANNDGDGSNPPVQGGGVSKLKQPSIILITPSTNNAKTSDAVYTLIAAVTNVNPTGISVKINGVAFSAYMYDVTTHRLTVPVALNMGANTVQITATSALGNKSETVTITKQEAR